MRRRMYAPVTAINANLTSLSFLEAVELGDGVPLADLSAPRLIDSTWGSNGRASAAQSPLRIAQLIQRSAVGLRLAKTWRPLQADSGHRGGVSAFAPKRKASRAEANRSRNAECIHGCIAIFAAR